MKFKDLCSRVGKSNLFTKSVAVKYDPRQSVLPKPGLPDAATRRFLAQIMLEEALETVQSLGVEIGADTAELLYRDTGVTVSPFADHPKDLPAVIDGFADTVYTASGGIVACGVPDLVPLGLVCDANDAKFPGGVATVNDAGKYLKPPGWAPPDHATTFRVLNSLLD